MIKINLNNKLKFASEITTELFKSFFEEMNNEFREISSKNNLIISNVNEPTSIFYKGTFYNAPDTVKGTSQLLDKSLYKEFEEYLSKLQLYEDDFNIVYRGIISLLKYTNCSEELKSALPNGLELIIPELNNYPRSQKYEEYIDNLECNVLDKSHIIRLKDTLLIYIGNLLLME